MTPFWHPLSTLLIADPVSFATEGVLRLMLPMAPMELLYAGDRMGSSVPHGTRFELRPAGEQDPAPGALIVVSLDGIPDLLRLQAVEGERLVLRADADPAPARSVPRSALLGVSSLTGSAPRGGHTRRRRQLDLIEAWRGRPDGDAAASVKFKYDMQAPFYAQVKEAGIDAGLERRFAERFPRPGEVLVVGCGTGRECFDLARLGWSVTGIDFSEPMIAEARAEAERRGVEARFEIGDIRSLPPAPASLDCVHFTYDVYSFIPTRAERIETLRALRARLRPGGALWLSARRVRRLYERGILWIQWLARRGEGVEWGASHTRFIGPDGRLHRSAVRVFDPAELRREIAEAGFAAGAWAGGHALLEPR